MKFQCDRCKTRYSIADERVRGKILKIRCKNCSAVITVKEGMEERAASPAPSNGSAAAAARPAAARKPAAAEPRRAAAAAVPSGSALQGAFQAVMARPQVAVAVPQPISPSDSFRAPVHIAEEWYLSVDGDQQGPFALDAAKEWVLSRPHDEELYCWQEDFDDWLPIEKVSHFRGLRNRIDTVETGPPRARTATPPPLPAAPARGPAGLRPESPIPLASLARQPLTEDTPKPLFDAAMKKIEARAASVAEPDEDEDEADPFAALRRPPTREPAGEAPAKRNGEANHGMFESVGDDPADNIDFDIGEASRIVKLPMLMATARDAGAAAPAASGGEALPGVAKIPAGDASRVGRGTGAALALRAPLAPLSDSALAEAQPPILTQSTLPPRRSPLLLPLIIGGGVLVVVLGILVAVMLSGGDDTDPELARSDVGSGELGGRDFRVGGGGGEEEGEAATSDPVKGGSDVRRRAVRPTVQTENGTNGGTPLVTGPVDPSATPLQPGEVITELQRQGLGNRRCYERALKKDPFLDVKSIPVKITVDARGVVTGVTLGSHADTVLGQCLTARLRQWAFRRSTKGISMNLTLTFEQTQ